MPAIRSSGAPRPEAKPTTIDNAGEHRPPGESFSTPRQKQILGAVNRAMADHAPSGDAYTQEGADPAGKYVDAEITGGATTDRLEQLANAALVGYGIQSFDVVEALAPLKLQAPDAYEAAVRSIAEFGHKPGGPSLQHESVDDVSGFIDDAVVHKEDPSSRYAGPEPVGQNL